MWDYRVCAHLARMGAASMALQLEHIPDDRLDWQPNPASKTAQQVVGEVVGVMRGCMPLFAGQPMAMGEGLPRPASRQEAVELLQQAAEAYATALEHVGPAVETTVPSPFGPIWAGYALLFGLVDLLHHHGQLTYIQSLLGDAEMHFSTEQAQRYLGPPA